MEKDPLLKGVTGIQNMGATCYANSILQLLRNCSEWNIFCITKQLLGRLSHLSENDPKRIIILGYQDIIQTLWSAYLPAYVRPVGFRNEIQKAVQNTPYEMFGKSIQCDSHEFLVYLLDQFHEAIKIQNPFSINESNTIESMAENGWRRALSNYNSEIVDIFFGMFQKKIQCSTCKNISYQWEVFNSLKVQCNGKSLYEWIRNEVNEINELTDYRCIPCKRDGHAIITHHLWKLPLYLFITIRRFHPNGQKNMTSPIYNGHPITLDEFFAYESPYRTLSQTYEVQGISDHHGGTMGGHYTAQTKHPLSGQWWWYDDENAKKLEGPQISESNYIYLFRKI